MQAYSGTQQASLSSPQGWQTGFMSWPGSVYRAAVMRRRLRLVQVRRGSWLLYCCTAKEKGGRVGARLTQHQRLSPSAHSPDTFCLPPALRGTICMFFMTPSPMTQVKFIPTSGTSGEISVPGISSHYFLPSSDRSHPSESF